MLSYQHESVEMSLKKKDKVTYGIMSGIYTTLCEVSAASKSRHVREIQQLTACIRKVIYNRLNKFINIFNKQTMFHLQNE